ncbi:MAG: hypothetical protein ACKPIF_14595, partial [Microcystis panniformis]
MIKRAIAPSTAVVGSNINVSWTVKNQGNGAATKESRQIQSQLRQNPLDQPGFPQKPQP